MSRRFEPLTVGGLDPDAVSLYDAILSSRKAVADVIGLVRRDGSLRGPFDPLLRSPRIGDAIQQLGIVLRAQSLLSPAVCEVAILTVVHLLDCTFEWQAHARIAVERELLRPEDLEDVAAGRGPSRSDARELAIAWAVSRQQVEDRDVQPATLEAAIDAFGERGVVELTALVGYYQLVALLMRTCAPVPEIV